MRLRRIILNSDTGMHCAMQVFQWARQAGARQPLTSGVWHFSIANGYESLKCGRGADAQRAHSGHRTDKKRTQSARRADAEAETGRILSASSAAAWTDGRAAGCGNGAGQGAGNSAGHGAGKSAGQGAGKGVWQRMRERVRGRVRGRTQHAAERVLSCFAAGRSSRFS